MNINKDPNVKYYTAYRLIVDTLILKRDAKEKESKNEKRDFLLKIFP
jgi:hypothetical protein